METILEHDTEKHIMDIKEDTSRVEQGTPNPHSYLTGKKKQNIIGIVSYISNYITEKEKQ